MSGEPAGLFAAPRYDPETPWPPHLATLAVVAILLAAAVAGTLCAAVLDLVRERAPASPHGFPSAADEAVRGMVWLIGFQAAVVAGTMAAARRLGGEPRRVLALDPPRQGLRLLLPALGILVVASLAYAGLVLFLDRTAFLRDLGVAAALVRSEAWPLAMFAIGIGAPLSEELLFRGFLFPAFARSRLGLTGAAVATTLGWTVLHAGYTTFGMVEVFLIGLYFCWLLVRSGSLWVPIACHAIYNTALAIALMWLPIGL